jgi:hypothetical protein
VKEKLSVEAYGSSRGVIEKLVAQEGLRLRCCWSMMHRGGQASCTSQLLILWFNEDLTYLISGLEAQAKKIRAL